MAMDDSNLVVLQRWMQAVITHPGGVRGGMQSPEARGHLDVDPERAESVISPSQALDSVGRLEVYANAYFARLMECLEEEFPATTAAVGAEAFGSLAFGYLRSNPSTSYTLNRLADRFPQFLAETRPPQEGDVAVPDWADLLVDLASLELHVRDVFDGPGIETGPALNAEDQRAIPPERWPSARLVPAPCLRVLEFRFPLNEYYGALRRGENSTPPTPKTSWLALTRREYVVRRLDLSRAEYLLLRSIIEGNSIQAAILRAAEAISDHHRFAEDLRQWFHDWTRAGLFLRVEEGRGMGEGGENPAYILPGQ